MQQGITSVYKQGKRLDCWEKTNVLRDKIIVALWKYEKKYWQTISGAVKKGNPKRKLGKPIPHDRITRESIGNLLM